MSRSIGRDGVLSVAEYGGGEVAGYVYPDGELDARVDGIVGSLEGLVSAVAVAGDIAGPSAVARPAWYRDLEAAHVTEHRPGVDRGGEPQGAVDANTVEPLSSHPISGVA